MAVCNRYRDIVPLRRMANGDRILSSPMATRPQRRRDLREYRKQVAALKRAGLVSASVDARKVKPTAALTRAINRYDDVLSGKASAVKVKPSTARAYRKIGHETAGGNRVIIGHLLGERARIDERLPPTAPEAVKTYHPKKGIERVHLPVGPDQVEQYLAENPDVIESMKKGRQRWGFTIGGYPSIRTFPSLEMSVEYVRYYKPRPGFRPSNLVIYRVRSDNEWQKKVRSKK